MLIQLREGMAVTPTRMIHNTRITDWKFVTECDDLGTGLMPGDRLEVVEVNKVPGNLWVRVAVPGSEPPVRLKVSNEDYAFNFRVVRD